MTNTPNVIDTSEARHCIVCGKKIVFSQDRWSLWYDGLCSDECMEQSVEAARREQLFKNAASILYKYGVPKRFTEASIENYQANSPGQVAVIQYIKSLDHTFDQSMLFTGLAGVGKTHLCVAAMRRLLPEFNRMQFVSSIEFVNRARGDFEKGHTWVDICSKVPLLVIDDLGVERVSEFAFEAWYRLIDGRYSSLRPTVITTNLNLKRLAERFDDRIASRLASGAVFNIDGKDRRLS